MSNTSYGQSKERKQPQPAATDSQKSKMTIVAPRLNDIDDILNACESSIGNVQNVDYGDQPISPAGVADAGASSQTIRPASNHPLFTPPPLLPSTAQSGRARRQIQPIIRFGQSVPSGDGAYSEDEDDADFVPNSRRFEARHVLSSHQPLPEPTSFGTSKQVDLNSHVTPAPGHGQSPIVNTFSSSTTGQAGNPSLAGSAPRIDGAELLKRCGHLLPKPPHPVVSETSYRINVEKQTTMEDTHGGKSLFNVTSSSSADLVKPTKRFGYCDRSEHAVNTNEEAPGVQELDLDAILTARRRRRPVMPRILSYFELTARDGPRAFESPLFPLGNIRERLGIDDEDNVKGDGERNKEPKRDNVEEMRNRELERLDDHATVDDEMKPEDKQGGNDDENGNGAEESCTSHGANAQ